MARLDLDALIRCNQKSDEFEQNLISRAFELGLQRPVFYALRYTQLILHTPVTEVIQKASQSGVPNKYQLRLMDFLFLRALMPDHSSCNDRWTGLARWLLYIYAHIGYGCHYIY
ncbi:hypothetical protein BMR05_14360 [Methylococcaceae bacterium HT4]|nr:hypothetical protein BMR04_16130 [Methylococcaceae bacterium HT3]TXL12769.1 hypothetical protein BMR05_14360 [Methylococcaceae bacterium HT4]TXL17947.1 hypothetical protein BMR06_14360 [Methylococcaceae bacterium HT5]